jgi:hypothetical protein
MKDVMEVYQIMHILMLLQMVLNKKPHIHTLVKMALAPIVLHQQLQLTLDILMLHQIVHPNYKPQLLNNQPQS